MKQIVAILLVSLCVFFVGCMYENIESTTEYAATRNPTHDSNLSTTVVAGSLAENWTETMYVQGYWYLYYTMEELDEAVDYVFEGKVVGIPFGVKDLRGDGSFIFSPVAEPNDRKLNLYAIYEIEVETNYKGECKDSVQLLVYGGISGYREREQYELLKACGWSRDGIFLVKDAKYLEIGKSYLFSSVVIKNGQLTSISPYQFALEPGEVPTCGPAILPSYDEIVSYYVRQ